MEPSLYCLLLEDAVGYKRDTDGNSSVYTEVLISKGSLIQALVTHDRLMEPFVNPPHNYKTMANAAVTLYCNCNQVHQLTTVQKDLLCGVQDLSDRFKAVDKLSWVETLEIGSSVYVTLPSANSFQKATVQYIGEVNGEFGRRFGLKLMVCNIIIMHLKLHNTHVCHMCFDLYRKKEKTKSVVLLKGLNISSVILVMAYLLQWIN